MITTTTIIQTINQGEGVLPDEFFSNTHLRRVADARALICYFLSAKLRLTEYQIGVLVNRDHSTVNVSINKAKNILLKKIYIYEMKLNSEISRNNIIKLAWQVNNGDPEARAKIKAEILTYANFYNVPIKQGRPKNNAFKSVFVEFIENKTGLIDILQRFYDSL